MSSIIDRSRWPIIVMSDPGPHDEGSIGRMIAELEAAFEEAKNHNEKLALVFVNDRMSRDARKLWDSWFGTTESLRGVVEFGARVVPTATLKRNRELVAQHIDSYPFVPHVDDSLDKCIDWAKSQFASA